MARKKHYIRISENRNDFYLGRKCVSKTIIYTDFIKVQVVKAEFTRKIFIAPGL